MATQRPDPVQRGLLDDIGATEAPRAPGAEDELLLQAMASRAIAQGSARTKMTHRRQCTKARDGGPRPPLDEFGPSVAPRGDGPVDGPSA